MVLAAGIEPAMVAYKTSSHSQWREQLYYSRQFNSILFYNHVFITFEKGRKKYFLNKKNILTAAENRTC